MSQPNHSSWIQTDATIGRGESMRFLLDRISAQPRDELQKTINCTGKNGIVLYREIDAAAVGGNPLQQPP